MGRGNRFIHKHQSCNSTGTKFDELFPKLVFLPDVFTVLFLLLLCFLAETLICGIEEADLVAEEEGLVAEEPELVAEEAHLAYRRGSRP